MIEFLNTLDTELFLFLNSLHHPVLDFMFYWISNKYVWIPLYIYLAWYLFKNERSDFIPLLFAVAIAITISDQIASGFLKHQVMRLRPCHDALIADQVHTVYGYCGGKYGFVSSHASNAFALLSFVYTLLRGNVWAFRYYLLLWACLHAYSRIYLGVHYPGDIIGGALVGIGAGYLMAQIFIWYKTRRHASR